MASRHRRLEPRRAAGGHSALRDEILPEVMGALEAEFSAEELEDHVLLDGGIRRARTFSKRSSALALWVSASLPRTRCLPTASRGSSRCWGNCARVCERDATDGLRQR